MHRLRSPHAARVIFARIAAAGLHALDTRRLAGHLAGFDLIFNTVPAPILTTEVLSDMKPPCFIIDLASLPGGVAADTLLPDGCRVLHALSLPGKVAPLSAARAVFDTVDTIEEVNRNRRAMGRFTEAPAEE